MASAPGHHVTAHDGTVDDSSSLPTSLKKQAAATGEALAEHIASADQNITTQLRDGTAAIADKVSGAASAVADAAAATYTTLEDGVKSVAGGHRSSADDTDTNDVQGAPTVTGFDGPSSRGQLGDHRGSKQPTVIASSPREAAQTGVAVDAPGAGANSVVAARTAAGSILDTLKGTFGMDGGLAAAPAGSNEPPSDPDPCTADVAVGDFKALKEALQQAMPGAATDDSSAVKDTADKDVKSGQDEPVGSTLLQDAKIGLVGAYDAAADAATTMKDALTGRANDKTGTSSNDGPPAAAAAASGSADVSGSRGGVLSALQQGWQDLKHGGAKPPQAVSTAGETAAPHDISSNIERSKHLDNPQQAKMYDAEVYRVSPGAQSSSGLAATNQGKAAGTAGAVAGDNRPVTGADPHGKPDSSKVYPDQTTRFSGDKGISTSFGTGSAAPWTGDDSIKAAAALFNTPSHLSQAEQQALAEGTASAVAGSAKPGAGSWVSSLSSLWSHFGRASAKGPTGNQVVKDIKFDNPTQDVMIDANRGAVKIDSETRGHKVMMPTPDQVPSQAAAAHGGSLSDIVAGKAQRLATTVSDSMTSSTSEAAVDPDNLKGKSSDNRPDGALHFVKEEAAVAGDALRHAPASLAGGLATAGEMVSGAAHHVVEGAQQLVTGSVQHPTPAHTPAQSAVSGLGSLTGGKQQQLQEERMAAIGDPAYRRETFGDKVIGPLAADARDETKAKQLAASYHRYKADKDNGTEHDRDNAAPPSGSDASAEIADAVHQAAHTARSAGQQVKTEATQAAQSTVQAAQDVTGKARDEAHELKDTAAHAVHKAAGAVTDTADEAASSAQASGQAVRDQVKGGASVAKDKAQAAWQWAAEKSEQTKEWAADKNEEAKQQVQDVKERAHDSASEAQAKAAAAGDAAGEAMGSLLSSVGGAAKALLGGMLGTFEKEGAFEETAAAVTGPPESFEPVGVEQLSGPETAGVEAARAHPAGAGNTGSAGAAAMSGSTERGAAAAAGADDVQQKLVEAAKEKIQDGVDDSARAAGLAAGHVQSSVEGVVDQVDASVHQLKEKAVAVAENVHVPPAEMTTTTEELLRQRQGGGEV